VSGPHLRLLDRYVNIQPWQNNRVKLRVPEGEVDYINASPIVLHPTTRRRGTATPAGQDGAADKGDGAEEELHRYIAMQGPKQTSQDHVWRMVVEQLDSPGVIVMLTETHEAGQEKCWQYFPREVGEKLEINPTDEFGDGLTGSVTCEGLEDTPAGDAIELRRLVVRVKRRRDENGQEVRGAERSKTPEERQGMDVARPRQDELDLDKLRSPTAEEVSGREAIGEGIMRTGPEVESGR
jgi:protein-tyrosine phosphatase